MNSEEPKLESGTSVPKGVVSRLSLYLRELQLLERVGEKTISSGKLGERLGFSDAQVRKDLGYFGQFGQPGVGYPCAELIHKIRVILGIDREWTVALVGVGNLGRALLGYRGFDSQGFRVVAAFDNDPAKIGTSVDGVPVHDLREVELIVHRQQIALGLIAVPAAVAQDIADRLVRGGVAGILNFAPMTLKLPENVSLVGVDLATELELLCFSVANNTNPR
jgi:redox-sensing transcriptional repressor